MDRLINEILKKHDIQDEKLANALAEIYELFVSEVDRELASKSARSSYMRGI